MGDVFSDYELAIQWLLEQLGKDHQRYDELLNYQTRLGENIQLVRAYGDTSEHKAVRNEILARLNQLAQETKGISFYEIIKTVRQEAEKPTPAKTAPKKKKTANERRKPAEVVETSRQPPSIPAGGGTPPPGGEGPKPKANGDAGSKQGMPRFGSRQKYLLAGGAWILISYLLLRMLAGPLGCWYQQLPEGLQNTVLDILRGAAVALLPGVLNVIVAFIGKDISAPKNSESNRTILSWLGTIFTAGLFVTIPSTFLLVYFLSISGMQNGAYVVPKCPTPTSPSITPPPTIETVTATLTPNSTPTLTPTPSTTPTLGITPDLTHQPTPPSATWMQIQGAGRFINALVADPDNPQVIYAGTKGGSNIYKSTDGGITWQPSSGNLPYSEVYGLGILGISPGNPARLYAVLGSPASLYTSSDEGKIWSKVGSVNGLSCSGCLYQLHIHPLDGRVMVIADGYGVTRSWDGGQNWAPVQDERGEKISAASAALDPTNPQVIYLGTKGSGVFKSSDGGQTWSPSNTGILDYVVTTLTVDPQDPQRVFAGTEEGQVFLSQDGGQTWSNSDKGSSDSSPDYGKIISLVIDPTAWDTVYALKEYTGFRVSTDSGQHWKPLGKPPVENNLTYPAGLVTVEPRFRLLLSVQGMGLWRYADDNPSPPESFTFTRRAVQFPPGLWREISDLPRAVKSVVFDPENSQTIFAGIGEQAPGNRLYQSSDGGATWQPGGGNLPDREVETLVFGPGSPAPLYASLGYGEVYKSLNRGIEWSLVGKNGSFSCIGCPRQMVIAPSNSQLIWMTDSYSALSFSTNGGQTWLKASDERGELLARSVAVDLHDEAIVYAGMQGNGVYKSLDGGTSWALANQSMLDYTVTALAVSPEDPNRLYAGSYDGELFRSVNGGLVWTDLTGRLPDTQGSLNSFLVIAINPQDPETIYCVVDHVGVAVSDDGGDNWALLGRPPGADYIRIRSAAITFQPKINLILVLEDPGGGVWQFVES